MKRKAFINDKIFDRKVIKELFVFVKPYIGLFYFLIIITFFLAALSPIKPLLIQYTVDNYILTADKSGLGMMIIFMVGLLLIQAVIQYGHTYLSGWLGQNIIKDIRIQLFKHVLKLRLKYYDNTPIGRLVTRNISDVETLSDVFSQGLAALAGDLLQLIFIIAIMFYTDWRLTLISLSMIPFLALSTWIFKEKIKYAFSQVRTAVANLNSFVQEHITGMSIVQIFSSEQTEYEKFKVINREHKRANLKTVMYFSIYFPVSEVLAAAGIGLLVWYGAKGVLEDHVTLGTLIAFIMYINLFYRPLRMIADRFNTLQLGIVSTDRIMKLLHNKDFIANNGRYIPLEIQNSKFKIQNSISNTQYPFKGAISFENVWFAYNDQDYVLKDISFEVKAGETIALVGATGAGKTSIVNLLNRFYEFNKGDIKIDNISIREYELFSLRKNIAVVLQDIFLFSGSIAENISLGNPEITKKQMWHAAELIGAVKFIEKLPGKFDYNVMERGATLSYGQRQLISFIRAMVYDPKIIILDEATSSVDLETERLIQSAIEKLMRGRTSIVIAHRLSTIQEADKIVVLDKGEIKETGKHEELLDLGGYYTELYDMQYKGHKFVK
ncbi:MAG: ABC transporter ATP-binding protein [Bacteroidetes bacterium]|nr:ABC transporter ATP-binding protein [Bacteroidota bacterium]